jgi:hypothetical protein
MWFAAGGIGGALKLRHLTGTQSGQVLVARHAGAEKLDVRNYRLHLGRTFASGRPFMLRVMQELMRSSMLISPPDRALYWGKSS